MRTKRINKKQRDRSGKGPVGPQIILCPELLSMTVSISTPHLRLKKGLTDQQVRKSLSILQNWVMKTDKSGNIWEQMTTTSEGKKKKRIDYMQNILEFEVIWNPHMRGLIFQSIFNFVSPVCVMKFCTSFALFDSYE